MATSKREAVEDGRVVRSKIVAATIPMLAAKKNIR